MKTPDTQDRLLDAAEKLFSENTVARTSLRAVTAEAGANLAAVNYHFGSKDGLVRAVFARRLGPLNEARIDLLRKAREVEGGAAPSVEAVVRAFLEPVLDMLHGPNPDGPSLDDTHQGGAHHFVRLMGRSIVIPAESTTTILAEQFREVLQRFSAAFAEVLPHIPRPELHRRYMYMVGAMAHTVATPGLMKIAGAQNLFADRDALRESLVTFLVTGMSAPVPASPTSDKEGGR